MEKVLGKIIEFRNKIGYSQETIAHELGMSQPDYSKIEKNETKIC